MANDLKNYLDFFKTLRAKIGSDKLISSDTSSGPWIGADGSPSTDLSEVRPVSPFLSLLERPRRLVLRAQFGNVLDFITIMES